MGQVIKFPVAKRFSKTKRSDSFTLELDTRIYAENKRKIDESIEKLDENLDKNITQMFDELGMDPK